MRRRRAFAHGLRPAIAIVGARRLMRRKHAAAACRARSRIQL